MKKIYFVFAFCLSVIASLAQSDGPKMEFKDSRHNFGFIRQGEKANFQFTFKNTGTVPVVIQDIKVECGCTIAEKPSGPVLPGKEGIINVTFDSAGKIDRQERKVKIISNAGETILTFKGVVLKAKD